MRKAIITNNVTGQQIIVHATTNNPACSYGRAVWEDDSGNAYCEVDSITPNPIFSIHEAGGAPLGVQIKQLRLARGLSIIELSRLSGVSRPNISALEAGNYNASERILRRIAIALDAELSIK